MSIRRTARKTMATILALIMLLSMIPLTTAAAPAATDLSNITYRQVTNLSEITP